eukprot:CAMPEP_0176412416 /NCGR_PEP_ID=MMETSP0127-20121128/4131_1 /TAXON_ID=938130 /ORGANISM="Platyophrya macrostoma, Strain WH" /LENGTH=497 /DNA_ID=CAMNT_0017792083 /DNA_START=105 /DNA_END=1598 /DNA_ORIENTATION=-
MRSLDRLPPLLLPQPQDADVAEDLPQWLNRGIASVGHRHPTTVQSYAIPLLMEAKDVVGIAPTGSGKTVAFAIPALSTFDVIRDRRRNHKAEPSILVLCPTRELTQQTKKVFMDLGAPNVVVRAAFGGMDRETQKRHLSEGADVLIATPGRLCDFVESGDISLNHVAFFVLDEADRMLELGFAPQLRYLVSKLPKAVFHKSSTAEQAAPLPVRRITMMWSATWSPTVEQLATGMLDRSNRLTIEVEQNQKINKDIEQRYYAVGDGSEKFSCLLKLFVEQVIPAGSKVIIFTNHKESTEKIAEDLLQGLSIHDSQLIQALHGGMKQPRRDAIMRKYRSGDIRVLVATDVAARGLDVPDIEHVVNFDLPVETDRYVHRIGRTGRAGKKGASHTIFAPSDGSYAADLVAFLERNGVKVPHDIIEVVNQSRFAYDRRQFSRFSERSPTSMSSSTEVDNWRRSDQRAPRYGGGGHGGHNRRPRHVITLKRDTSSPSDSHNEA